jgi:hypothetical protein
VRKGQGNVIIATIFAALFLAFVLPLATHLYTSYTANIKTPYSQALADVVIQVAQRASEQVLAIYNESNTVLYILNYRGKPLDIERLIVTVSCIEGVRVASLKPQEVSIPSGQQKVLNLSQAVALVLQGCTKPNTTAFYIVTQQGTVIPAEVISLRIVQELQTEAGTGFLTRVGGGEKIVTALPIPIKSADQLWNISLLQAKGFTIATLDSMTSPAILTPDSTLASSSGMRSAGSSWRLVRVTSGSITVNIGTVYNLWFGYDPRDTSKYNIMFTTTGYSPCSSTTLSKVKIYGFRSSLTQGVLQISNKWVKEPSQDVANYTFKNTNLYLTGTADRIEIYCRDGSGEVSYNPYTMLMNTVRSEGFAGLLFTTIDRSYRASLSSVPDGDTSRLDYSSKPFALVYNYSISSKQYTAVAIAVNYRFHDAEGLDADGVKSDLPIMLVGLAYRDGNVFRVYSYRSFTFRELTRYEDTYPPTAQAQSAVVFIPLPQGVDREFHVFIALQDPYNYVQSGSYYYDCVDFTLYVENLSILPFR